MNLHPLFEQILAAYGMPQNTSRSEEYAAALRCFDWQFTFSSDYRYVQTQRAALRVLRAEQAAIDPDFEIWNAHTPVENWNGIVSL